MCVYEICFKMTWLNRYFVRCALSLMVEFKGCFTREKVRHIKCKVRQGCGRILLIVWISPGRRVVLRTYAVEVVPPAYAFKKVFRRQLLLKLSCIKYNRYIQNLNGMCVSICSFHIGTINPSLGLIALYFIISFVCHSKTISKCKIMNFAFRLHKKSIFFFV